MGFSRRLSRIALLFGRSRRSALRAAEARGLARNFGNRGRRRVLIVGFGLFSSWLMPRDGSAAEAKRFAVPIEEGSAPKAQRTLRVTEGDTVEIRFTSDRLLVLHLHGLDIEERVGPGQPAVMAFEATVAGRFPMEVHGQGANGALLYVEVHPR
jgi:hypothetical protein